MSDKIKFFLQEFDSLTNKEKVRLLNVIVRDYAGIVAYAELDETNKKVWQTHFGDLAKDYLKEDNNCF